MTVRFALNDGTSIPALGFGTYQMTPQECERSVLQALQDGYRLIDTANAYMNERAVGRAMRKSGLARAEIYLTTKLWPKDYGRGKTSAAIDATLKRLDVDCIDLLLLHQQYGDYLGAWEDMQDAVRDGRVRSLGLSNFNLARLQNLIGRAELKPTVLQVECHPYDQQRGLKDFLAPYDIAVEAWYPIGHGDRNLLTEDLFQTLGRKYGKSAVQIILRWHIQDGNVVIPKSTDPAHIRSNLELFDFELTSEEMTAIGAMDRNRRYFEMSEAEQERMFLNWDVDFDAQE